MSYPLLPVPSNYIAQVSELPDPDQFVDGIQDSVLPDVLVFAGAIATILASVLIVRSLIARI